MLFSKEKMNFLFFIILCFFEINRTITIESKCLLDDSNKKRFEAIQIANFDSFNQLNFSCDNKTMVLSFIEIKPNKKLILNNSLNLNGSIIQPKNLIFAIMLNNFKGFEIQQNPFKNIKLLNFNLQNTIWNVKNSNFDFYNNNLENFCDESVLIEDIPISNVSYIKHLRILHSTTIQKKIFARIKNFHIKNLFYPN